MTRSRPVVLHGSQLPRLERRPAERTNAASEAADLAVKLGKPLFPWQRHVFDVSLGEVDRRWSAFEVGLVVPRQNGKTYLLLIRCLAGLLCFGERLILWSSQLGSTNDESFRALQEMVEEHDFLSLRIKGVRKTNGQTMVEFKGGQRVRFICRSENSGRGFSADCVMMDEAYELDDGVMGAMLPTLVARPNPQVWYTSSAPKATSHVLWRVRNRALTGQDVDRFAFCEWSVDPDAFDASSPESWAEANPSLGYNLRLDGLQAQFNALSRAEFVREFCGVPDPELDGTENRAFDPAAWAACWDGRPADVVDGRAVGFDVSVDGTFASVVGSGLDKTGLVRLEVIDHGKPGDWLVPLIVAACKKHKCPVVLDPAGLAGGYLPDLVAADVKVETVKGRDVYQACGRFQRLVKEGQVRHLGTGELGSAAATAEMQWSGDAFKWKRRTVDSPDLSPLYAATLAAWYSVVQPAKKSIISFSG